ncbi:hypothetical protein CMUS01_03353 [Colletotrichum musicola]|uniref:Uncharacterized protein n=1 Tax=Colletotrichum musicola TaxID=2175873 RepID=A0A8H6NTA6_9PEZI|nr:hypothetical protein CMUS01_03353 [Colletotrichum musicola]
MKFFTTTPQPQIVTISTYLHVRCQVLNLEPRLTMRIAEERKKRGNLTETFACDGLNTGVNKFNVYPTMKKTQEKFMSIKGHCQSQRIRRLLSLPMPGWSPAMESRRNKLKALLHITSSNFKSNKLQCQDILAAQIACSVAGLENMVITAAPEMDAFSERLVAAITDAPVRTHSHDHTFTLYKATLRNQVKYLSFGRPTDIFSHRAICTGCAYELVNNRDKKLPGGPNVHEPRFLSLGDWKDKMQEEKRDIKLIKFLGGEYRTPSY